MVYKLNEKVYDLIEKTLFNQIVDSEGDSPVLSLRFN